MEPRDSLVYLVENPARRAFKIGIAVVHGDRLELLRRQGWSELHLTLEPLTRAQARGVERAALRTLRSRGLESVPGAYEGHSETVSSDAITATSLFRLLHSELYRVLPLRALHPAEYLVLAASSRERAAHQRRCTHRGRSVCAECAPATRAA